MISGLRDRSRSLKIVQFKSLGALSIAIMAVSFPVSEIFSVNWPNGSLTVIVNGSIR